MSSGFCHLDFGHLKLFRGFRASDFAILVRGIVRGRSLANRIDPKLESEQKRSEHAQGG